MFGTYLYWKCICHLSEIEILLCYPILYPTILVPCPINSGFYIPEMLNPIFANIPSLWVEVLPEAVEWKHGASTIVYFCFHLETYCWAHTAMWPVLFCFISCIANPPHLPRAGKRETPLTYCIHILSTTKKFLFENDARSKHSDVVLIILDKQHS